ncbi:GlyGly-CTERM sorting domain-containing protein, partial [Kaarinaea lacus]
VEAIKEESKMGYLADILSESDIQAITAYLNNDGEQSNYESDYHYDGMRGDYGDDHDGKDDDDYHEGKRGDDGGDNGDGSNKQCDISKNDGNKGNHKDRGSSNGNANPFTTGQADSSIQSTTAGGGALNWLALICSMFWLAVRKRRDK